MTDYAAVLSVLFPDAEWSLNGDSYDGLTWLSDGDAPTKEMLDAAWPAVNHERTVAAIRAERERRFRAETDPMFMKVQRGEGVTLDEWKAAVEQVRADLPYPDAP